MVFHTVSLSGEGEQGMDFATIIGVFVGVFLVLSVIFQGGGASFFFNVPSLLIVGGGTLAATFVNFPISDVLRVLKVVSKAFLHKASSPYQTIELVVSMSEKVRREGILALDRELESLEDDFLRKGAQLAVDGMEPDAIRDILSMEITRLEDRHKVGQGIFTAMGNYAPAFGMIGTLIGLIRMLRTLEDPTQIGAGMAMALVTTLYGVLMANLIFLPIAGKLKERSQQEVLLNELMLEGILAIQSGDNPRIVRDRLMGFLPPKQRTAPEV